MKLGTKLKRTGIVVLCFLMILGSFPMNVSADEEDEVSLTLSCKTVPGGKYGESMSVRLYAHNTGDVNLGSIRVRVNVDESFASIFEVITSSINERKYGNLSSSDTSGDSEIFPFKVRKDAKTGYYPITFQVKFQANDEAHTSLSTIYVYIEGEDDLDEEEKKIKFVLGENQDTPFGEYPGVMDYSVNIQNQGTDTAYDVSANMVLSEDVTAFPFEISLGNYDRPIGTMKSGEEKQLTYSMALREHIKTGYYPLNFNITYREKVDGELKTVEKIFYVKTKGEEDEEDTNNDEIDVNTVEKPRLIIAGYSTDPEVIKSGDEFVLTLHMKNTSKTIAATNILFTLEAEQVDGNAVFTPLSGSTAVVIDTMSPGQTTDIVMPMIAKAGVSPKSYTLSVKQKYDIVKLKSIEDTASVAIPVKQIPKLSVGTVEVMPESIQAGAESNVMFGINNTGKITLYNVNVMFQSDAIDSAESYVGNIEPGATGNVDAMIRGAAANMEDSKIIAVISYEDDAGVVSTMEKEFDLLIMEEMLEDPGEFFPVDGIVDSGKQQSFFGKYKFIIFGLSAVLVAAAGIVVLKIRKKKLAKKEENKLADEIKEEEDGFTGEIKGEIKIEEGFFDEIKIEEEGSPDEIS